MGFEEWGTPFINPEGEKIHFKLAQLERNLCLLFSASFCQCSRGLSPLLRYYNFVECLPINITSWGTLVAVDNMDLSWMNLLFSVNILAQKVYLVVKYKQKGLKTRNKSSHECWQHCQPFRVFWYTSFYFVSFIPIPRKSCSEARASVILFVETEKWNDVPMGTQLS